MYLNIYIYISIYLSIYIATVPCSCQPNKTVLLRPRFPVRRDVFLNICHLYIYIYITYIYITYIYYIYIYIFVTYTSIYIYYIYVYILHIYIIYVYIHVHTHIHKHINLHYLYLPNYYTPLCGIHCFMAAYVIYILLTPYTCVIARLYTTHFTGCPYTIYIIYISMALYHVFFRAILSKFG